MLLKDVLRHINLEVTPSVFLFFCYLENLWGRDKLPVPLQPPLTKCYDFTVLHFAEAAEDSGVSLCCGKESFGANLY